MNLLSPFFLLSINSFIKALQLGHGGRGAGDRNNQLSFSIEIRKNSQHVSLCMQKLCTIMVLIYWVPVMIFAIPMFLVLVSKKDFWLFRVIASREHNIQFF